MWLNFSCLYPPISTCRFRFFLDCLLQWKSASKDLQDGCYALRMLRSQDQHGSTISIHFQFRKLWKDVETSVFCTSYRGIFPEAAPNTICRTMTSSSVCVTKLGTSWHTASVHRRASDLPQLKTYDMIIIYYDLLKHVERISKQFNTSKILRSTNHMEKCWPTNPVSQFKRKMRKRMKHVYTCVLYINILCIMLYIYIIIWYMNIIRPSRRFTVALRRRLELRVRLLRVRPEERPPQFAKAQ